MEHLLVHFLLEIASGGNTFASLLRSSNVEVKQIS